MELLVFLVIVLVAIVIAISERSLNRRRTPYRGRHSGRSQNRTGFTISDPDYITHSQYIHHQSGFAGSESGDIHSAYDSSAPMDNGPSDSQGDFGGGGYSDSGCSSDSGGSSSSDCGSGSSD